MENLELMVIHEEQPNADTLKMFLWGDGFLARIMRDGKMTEETIALRIHRVQHPDGTRRAILHTNYGVFEGMWPLLKRIK